MFHHLEGTVTDLTGEKTALDCGGIGFYILITPNTASMLKNGEKAKLYISESLGEDHFDLYGFPTLNEKRYFELLTTVSGVGPKAGMSILSYNSPESITGAIVNNNESAFTACPGIGKKTAQRIILELKDKISKEFDTSIDNFDLQPLTRESSSAYDQALSALVSLGYSSNDVIQILKQIETKDMTSDQIIRSVLRYMI